MTFRYAHAPIPPISINVITNLPRYTFNKIVYTIHRKKHKSYQPAGLYTPKVDRIWIISKWYPIPGCHNRFSKNVSPWELSKCLRKSQFGVEIINLYLPSIWPCKRCRISFHRVIAGHRLISIYFFYFLFFIKTYLTRITHQPRAVLHEVLPYTTQLINIVTIVQHETW